MSFRASWFSQTLAFCIFGLGLSLLAGCQQHYSPKPRGFFRIDMPEKGYTIYEGACPFTFELPVYAQLSPSQIQGAPSCWFDLVFPDFNATLHLSYIPVRDREHVEQLTEDARKYAFAHVGRATEIRQQPLAYQGPRVFGIFYDIEGNVASGLQFFATDSNKHYLRGALYFNSDTEADSIQPVKEFLRADLQHLLNTLRWE